MTAEEKTYSMLSLAMKAGALKCGNFSCTEAVKKGKAYLVILSADMAEGSAEKLISQCRSAGVPVVRFGTKEGLARAIGKEYTSCIAITDASFSDGIRGKIQG